MVKKVILGGGITGLSAGYKTDVPIFEAKSVSGGICASYYIALNKPNHALYQRSIGEEDYRFELGGGHWIFGGNASILDFVNKLTPLKQYTRRASVYLPNENVFVPYPIQNNLHILGHTLAQKIFGELSTQKASVGSTMHDWLMHHFGPALNQLFFKPFGGVTFFL
ncbi:MAG: protoporphyrinogen oxidase [Candidatus Omnitrophota bacterium]|jgi:protoporphyrinogen oxidase